MLERSTGSVTVIYLDREAVIEKTRAAVDALAHQHAEIERVVLFGSMARGDAVPGSDVDLLMVLSESRFPFLDRSVEYKPKGIPVAVDVFAYTEDEIEKMTHDGHMLLKQALSEGVTVYDRHAGAVNIPEGERVAEDH
jgi:predicted nucleotidyltransferase